MKRLLFRLLAVAVLGIGLWLGVLAARGLFRKPVTHDAMIINAGKRDIAELAMRVGRRRIELGAVAGGDTARTGFRLARDAVIELRWTWDDTPGDEHVRRVARMARGPIPHHLKVVLRDDGGVLSRMELDD